MRPFGLGSNILLHSFFIVNNEILDFYQILDCCLYSSYSKDCPAPLLDCLWCSAVFSGASVSFSLPCLTKLEALLKAQNWLSFEGYFLKRLCLLAGLIADLLKLAHGSVRTSLANNANPIHAKLLAISITVYKEENQR